MNLGNRHSQHSFATVPTANIERSFFNRSFAAKDTMYFDDLTPMFVDEMLPSDTVNMKLKMFARLAPQVVPLMDNMYLDVYWFFVPNRIVWDNFEKFMGQQNSPGDSTDYLIPKLADGGEFEVGSIYDKFGLPTDVAAITTHNRINALPMRGYNLIFNLWFRDQNLVDPLTVLTTDGPDPIANYTIVKGAKAHDYFTSALPWAQKGSPVQIPLGTYAPVINNGPNAQQMYVHNWVAKTDEGIVQSNSAQDLRSSVALSGGTYLDVGFGRLDGTTGLSADLSDASAATVDSLLMAFMMQSMLAADARNGTRYPEVVQGHFNTTVPDFRIQYPELLSISRTFISQHVVAQTSETATTPQGNLAAYSTAAETSGMAGFSKSFNEHGYVIGLIRARGDVTYQQGVNRMWLKSTRWDLFWPKLQQAGEQQIYKGEIYAQGSSADMEPWGYQERYAEYRYMPSQIRGQFRSTFAQSLDVWHLAQEFGSLPSLNSTFITSDTPIERSLVLPDEDYPHLLVDYWFDYKHSRPMTTYGVPASLGRF